MPLQKITPFLSHWRTIRVSNREFVDAVVSDTELARTAELKDALGDWPGVHYFDGKDPNRLLLIRPLGKRTKERWVLHISLFCITFITVWLAGATLFGPVRTPNFTFADLSFWASIERFYLAWEDSLAFAAALVGILLSHELGHYFMAKRYQVDASPPYFIPAPPIIVFGTLGAFIRLRSPIADRRQLFDIGAAGPWAGVLVSIILLAVGLNLSDVISGVQGGSDQLIYYGNRPFFLGDSLLMTWMREAIVGPGTVNLHPLATAGWFGLFVTMLNLFPLGQLDGGHIAFALVGRFQTAIGALMWVGLLVLSFEFLGWGLWALVILLLGRGRIAHPSVMDPYRTTPRIRWFWGIATVILFILTFTPNPLPTVGSVRGFFG